MIAPSNTLLFWTSFIVLPCSCLAGMMPSSRPICLIILLAFFVLILVDITLSMSCFADIHITVPHISRMTKGRNSAIRIGLRLKGGQSRQLRLGLNLPPEIESESDIIALEIEHGKENVLVNWPCMPICRGRFVISSYALETLSRFRFWAMRTRNSIHSEIRVYPNLISERRTLSSLFLSRHRIGVHNRRQVGQGREFEKIREYLPGDSIDQIHWKATAKHNAPMSKIFQIEKTQEVYAVVDTSRLTARTTSDREGNVEPLIEQFMKASLLMGLVTRRYDDLFGLITFSNQVNTFLRAKGGKSHFDACRESIYLLQTEQVSPDYKELATLIKQRLKKRVLLIIFTSLDDPLLAEEFVKSIKIISKQHLIIVVTLRSENSARLFVADDKVNSIHDIYHKLAGHIQVQTLWELEKLLRRHGVALLQPQSHDLCLESIRQYTGIKMRQIL